MLPAGTWMRPIEPDDKALLAAGVGRLSPESAYGRFLTGKSRLTPAELRYLTEIDHRDHIAFLVLDELGDLVAVGRIVRDARRADTGEIALVVADCWQRRGIGRVLANRLTQAMGVARVSGTMLATNRAAYAIMRGLGPIEHASLSGGIRELVARVGAPVAAAAA
jgi:GNAT superfamily N-acetyltransferase